MVNKIVRMLIVISLVMGINGCKGLETSSQSTVEALTSNATRQGSIYQTDSDQESKPAFESVLKESREPWNKSSNSQDLRDLPDLPGLHIRQIPILYYHSVMLEAKNEVRMPPDQFEAQMDFLCDNGYQSITLNQLYRAFYQGASLPPKPFVITFDDGYLDNYTTAFPILRRYGFTATVFMVSSYIGGEDFLSWPQLKELVASGWEIEGHTDTHPYLSKIDEITLLHELKSSKELLELGLGKTVDFLAYPYGDFDSAVLQAVRDTGYLMAFTTERGWANPNSDARQIQRIYCYANMGQNEFSRRLQNWNY